MSKIGVLFKLKPDADIFEEMKKVKDTGFDCCQLTVWDMELYTDEIAERFQRRQRNMTLRYLPFGQAGQARVLGTLQRVLCSSVLFPPHTECSAQRTSCAA